MTESKWLEYGKEQWIDLSKVVGVCRLKDSGCHVYFLGDTEYWHLTGEEADSLLALIAEQAG